MCDKIAKIGQNFACTMLKSKPARKSTSLTNIMGRWHCDDDDKEMVMATSLMKR